MGSTSTRPRHLALALATAVLVTGTSAPAVVAGTPTATTPGAHVVRTGTGPTGYAVTFAYAAPDAGSVRIKGTWSFASHDSVADDPTNASPTSAWDWEPGDFPLQSPNTPGEGWPVTEMTRDPATGLWTTTVPLPSGVFDYQFYVDCAAALPSVSGCASSTDPAAPAWSSAGSAVRWSEVYVPSDPDFGTEDLSFLREAPADERGTLEVVTYPTSRTRTGENRAVVYLPAGYDPQRAEPYPLLVLSHGGGEDEMVWSTRGRLPQVVDGLTAEGLMQPTVVVMPNGSGVSDYTTEVLERLPQLAERYHVSTEPQDRAFAGTSAFGTQANNLLFQETGAFGYVGVWSPAAGAPTVEQIGAGFPAGPPTGPAYQDPALLGVPGIHLAIGEQDLGGNAPLLTTTLERIALQNAGVPFRYFTEGGGHTFAFWRDTLRDFLTEVAFRSTTSTVTASGGDLVATVVAVSTEPAAPTGTVQLLVDGQPLGDPVALEDGTATLPGRALDWSGRSVTAVYEGDALYDASTSEPVPVSAAPDALLDALASTARSLAEDGQVGLRFGRTLERYVAVAQRAQARGQAQQAVAQLDQLVAALDDPPAHADVSAGADAALRAAVATTRAALVGG